MGGVGSAPRPLRHQWQHSDDDPRVMCGTLSGVHLYTLCGKVYVKRQSKLEDCSMASAGPRPSLLHAGCSLCRPAASAAYPDTNRTLMKPMLAIAMVG